MALALSALFLGFDLGTHPIVLWDESRGLANALEMNRSGLSLVTTYDWRPDLWNTKPPLVVWLIVLSVRLFGASEWAMRLPSFLAAVGTVALTMAFAWRLTRSRFVTFCATILLVFSFGFYGYHAAWTVEYDAALGLFTTAYLLCLFEALHRSRPGRLLIVSCALMIALACLTKGVAGLIPGVGVAAYVIVRGRFPRLFRTPWYAIGAVVVAFLVGGFYILRERAAPGYFAAIMQTELGGRYLQTKGENERPWYFYLMMLPVLFSVPPALLALLSAPLLKWPNTRAKAFLVYGAHVCATMLLVLSLGRTKAFWYMVPIYPVLSLIAAIALERVREVLAERRSLSIGPVPLLLAAGAFAAIAVVIKVLVLPPFAATREGGYGRVFADLSRAGYRRVVVVEPGARNKEEGRDAYAPILHDYAIIWRNRGLVVERVLSLSAAHASARTALASCSAEVVPLLRARGPALVRVPGCSAVNATTTPR